MTEDKDILNKSKFKKDQIFLISLLKILNRGRRKIIKITIIFTIIGLFIAVFAEKEYTASTIIVPQTSTGKSLGGNLGGLAVIAGIDIGSSSSNDSGISPLLYPHLLNSVPFQKELLETSLTIDGYEDSITFQKFYTDIYRPSVLGIIKKYTIGLPKIIFRRTKVKPVINSLDSKKQIFRITRDEKELIEQLKKQITLSVNEKEGFVSISSKMPNPLNAAELTQNIQELLQKYIIDFKVKKSMDQLRFINERYKEKEKVYQEAQIKLALFQDSNQFMNSALAKNTQTRYQADYDLAFSVYSELAKQQEKQQIKVKEDTPVFTILEPVSIPIDKSEPKRGLIILICLFAGLIAGVFLVLTKEIIFKIIKKISNSK
jgi:LPS O-antigen subunit length determinant protein (WzzB/FepE family)